MHLIIYVDDDRSHQLLLLLGAQRTRQRRSLRTPQQLLGNCCVYAAHMLLSCAFEFVTDTWAVYVICSLLSRAVLVARISEGFATAPTLNGAFLPRNMVYEF